MGYIVCAHKLYNLGENKMRLTRRQLKRIIKEEYSKLVKAGLISENYMNEDDDEEGVGDEADLREADEEEEDEDDDLAGEADIREAVRRAKLRKIIRKNTTSGRRTQRRRRR